MAGAKNASASVTNAGSSAGMETATAPEPALSTPTFATNQLLLRLRSLEAPATPTPDCS